jgi:hypothetical protein
LGLLLNTCTRVMTVQNFVKSPQFTHVSKLVTSYNCYVFSSPHTLHLSPRSYISVMDYGIQSVECLTLMLRIREVPGSNIGPDTSYPEGFRGSPQSLQANAGIVP